MFPTSPFHHPSVDFSMTVIVSPFVSCNSSSSRGSYENFTVAIVREDIWKIRRMIEIARKKDHENYWLIIFETISVLFF